MRCGGEDRFIHASHAIEHPSRNLKPASGIGAAPRAAEHNIIGLVDRLMDKNRQAEPWMPPIQKLAKAGPVGVIKLRCTTTSEHIDHRITMRRSLARFSALESSVRTRYSADFIITTPGFRFSVHTGLQRGVPHDLQQNADSSFQIGVSRGDRYELHLADPRTESSCRKSR